MSVSIRFAGSGGQGAVLSGIVMARAAVLYEQRHATQKDGKFAIQTQSYGPEVRGSVTKSDVKISDDKIYYPYVHVPDVFVALSEQAYGQYAAEVGPNTTVLIDEDLVRVEQSHRQPTGTIHRIPAQKIAKELGLEVVANIVMIGALCGLTGVLSLESVEKAVLEIVPESSQELNRQALRRGFEVGEKAGGSR
jgi:2-oxoglutarate ferredoxin oxidoreductase subunit gamma